MRKPQDRKKVSKPKQLLPAYGAEQRKYEALYLQFNREGYTKDLCEDYAEEFVNEQKKPSPEDIIQLVRLYDHIHDLSSAEFYLSMLEDKKLSGEDRFGYCLESLKVKSKLGHWRDAEDFRTENISFMQKYSEKISMDRLAEMYIALALVDCAARKYNQAGKLLTAFGYKPQGNSDPTLLEMMITAVYISAKSEDKDLLIQSIKNAQICLNRFTSFEHPWSKEYYIMRIEDAANGIL